MTTKDDLRRLLGRECALGDDEETRWSSAHYDAIEAVLDGLRAYLGIDGGGR